MIFENELMSPLKVKVDINAAGNIKQTDETTAGAKYLSINGISSDIDFDAASDVAVSIVGGVFGAVFANDFKQTVDREVTSGTTPNVTFLQLESVTAPTEVTDYYGDLTNATINFYHVRFKTPTLSVENGLGIAVKGINVSASRIYGYDANGFIDDDNHYVDLDTGGTMEIPETWAKKNMYIAVIIGE